MNVQSSTFKHREALHAQLQMDRFRFVKKSEIRDKTYYSTYRGSKP